MCKHGEAVDALVNIPAHLSYTGKARWAIKPIDSCIVEKVRELNAQGILTVSSCCGHGRFLPEITLSDGTVLRCVDSVWRQG